MQLYRLTLAISFVSEVDWYKQSLSGKNQKPNPILASSILKIEKPNRPVRNWIQILTKNQRLESNINQLLLFRNKFLWKPIPRLAGKSKSWESPFLISKTWRTVQSSENPFRLKKTVNLSPSSNHRNHWRIPQSSCFNLRVKAGGGDSESRHQRA